LLSTPDTSVNQKLASIEALGEMVEKTEISMMDIKSEESDNSTPTIPELSFTINSAFANLICLDQYFLSKPIRSA